jgi:hypothetical protein
VLAGIGETVPISVNNRRRRPSRKNPGELVHLLSILSSGRNRCSSPSP